MRSRLLCGAVLVAAATAFPGCPALRPTPEGGCRSVEYEGVKVDVDAQYGLFGFKGSGRTQASREVSETMQLYLKESERLCRMYEKGDLSVVDYDAKSNALSMRFADLVRLNKSASSELVQADEQPFYAESLDALKPGATLESAEATLKVFSQGRLLRSGDEMKSGERFHIEIAVPKRAFLYLVLIDSSGQTSRLYPADLTGIENPVQGNIRIPREGGDFQLDDKPGTERLMILVQSTRSRAVESSLAEVGAAGSPSQTILATRGLQVLTRGIQVKQSLAVVSGSQVASAFGQAAMEFTIKHK